MAANLNNLQLTLTEHLKSDWQSNPAVKTLVDDYAKYHAVLALAGSVTLLILLALTTIFWIRFKKQSRTEQRKWPFEKKVYFWFGLVLTLFTMFFVLIVVANISTARKPIPGFTLLANSVSTPDDSTEGHALSAWIQSGESTMPAVLDQKVQDRISWQRPKAIICGMLLIVTIFINGYIWRYLIRYSNKEGKKWQPKERLLLAAGSITFGLSLLLLVMALANMQGSIAPIAMSLLGVGN